MSRRISGSPLSVTVAGADGFIGRHVVRQLLEYGIVVTALIGPGATGDDLLVEAWFSGDIEDRGLLCRGIRGADVVIHLAGPPEVVASFADPANCLRVHAVGTARLMEMCREQRVGRVVFVSSAEIYGEPPVLPVSESAPAAPRSPYGVAKYAAEGLVRSLATAGDSEAVLLRLFSVYGVRKKNASVMECILDQVARGAPLSLADRSCVRDWCHVEDAARAIVAAAVAPLPRAIRTYNVASGKGVSLAEIAEIVARLTGRPLIWAEGRSDRPRGASARELVASVGRIAAELSWTPKIPLEEGLSWVLKARREAMA